MLKSWEQYTKKNNVYGVTPTGKECFESGWKSCALALENNRKKLLEQEPIVHDKEQFIIDSFGPLMTTVGLIALSILLYYFISR